MELTQAQVQAKIEPHKRLLKAKAPKTYLKKFYIYYYHFYQQCEDHFKISDATGMNCTLFAVLYLCTSISLRQAQHKRRYKSAILITYFNFKTFLHKDFGDSLYQLEKAQNWASHLQHFQFIQIKFNTIGAFNKLTIICYFWKNLKSSIKVKIEQQD